MILQALPSKYSQLKVSYNTQDKSWDIDELIAQCVQEETRQQQERGKDVEIVNFVQGGRGKKFNNAGNNSSKNFKCSKPSDKTGTSAKIFDISKGSNNLKPKIKNVAKLKCFFCKTRGHLRKDCELFKDYLRANGKEIGNVCEESFDQWE